MRWSRAISLAGLLAVVGLWGAALPAQALDVPPLRGRVDDEAGLLTPQQAAALEAKLNAYEQGSGHQFALLIIPSLEGGSLEDFSIRVVEDWKLGKKGKDDGVLVLVAAKDHKMRIEVGYGLEGDIPDAIASRIEREIMQPAFRAHDYYGGLDRAFGYLMQAAGGESVQLPEQRVRRRRPGAASFIQWGVIALIILLSMFGGGGGRRRRRGFYMMGGGFGGGGFGGGGFGGGGGGFSGGGGGFGGGGASGDW